MTKSLFDSLAESKSFENSEHDRDFLYMESLSDNDPARVFLESLYDRFSKLDLIEPNFLAELRRQFHSRFWEMYLACALADHGHKLETLTNRKDRRKGEEGIDLKVLTASGTVWIEAVAPKSGEVGNPDSAHVPESPTVHDLAELPNGEEISSCCVRSDSIVFRMTRAIQQKVKQQNSKIKEGHVSPNDPFIIAINGYDIQGTGSAIPPSEIESTLFGIGNQSGSYNKHTKSIENQKYRAQPKRYKTKIDSTSGRKLNGSPVDSNLFATETHGQISAVIYSRANVWNCPELLGSDFVLLRNTFAKNPIEKDFLKCGSVVTYIDGVREQDYYLK
ncbi:MAG: hypothetical protein JNK57_10650 [Planctomycetaceae bacterium]|nr:hypothetical protein [Planctomycetaceae bacterium]